MKQCSNPECAKIKPLTEFYNNKTKKNGVMSRCKTCTDKAAVAYRETPIGKEIMFLSRKKYRKSPKGVVTQKKFEKTDKAKNHHKKYNQTAAGKASRIKKGRKYGQTLKGRAKISAKTMKRYASKKNRTPKWTTEEQLHKIQELYIEAAKLTSETGILHHVDHIIPLQGEEISGLHVFHNLQILTDLQNIKKSNNFDFTYNNDSWRNI